MAAQTNVHIQHDPVQWWLQRVLTSESASLSERRRFRGHPSGIFCKLPIHFSKGPPLSAAHSLHPFQFITPSPTCIILPATHSLPSLGANLLVEAFWLHLPFKSYRLKLDIFPLSQLCSSIAGDLWDFLPSALMSSGTLFALPLLEILEMSLVFWNLVWQSLCNLFQQQHHFIHGISEYFDISYY